jgi:ribose transport system ATP-binding protein
MSLEKKHLMNENSGLLLEVKCCSKGFPGVQAFNKVDFDLYKGEIHCIVGENGAGKSTFIKILSGALKPDEGTISINSEEYSQLSPTKAHELGIQTIYQEISLIPDLTVGENIFIGNWPLKKIRLIDFKKINDKAQKILDDLQIELDLDATVKDLGVAHKQSVQIAKAMAQEAKIFIFDEPTAAYNSNEIENLLELVKQCAKNGIGVIYISHHMNEVFDINDRITVLRDGNKIGTYKRDEVSEEDIMRYMIGRDINKFYYREDAFIDKSKYIEFKNFSDNCLVKNASLKIYKGEIVGLAGMVGSGRTELVSMIYGARKRVTGNIFFEGRETINASPRKAIKKGFSFLTEDRQRDGLILEHSVAWNISLVSLSTNVKKLISERDEKDSVKSYIKKLNIKTSSLNEIIKNLSGGNQQKVVLAKWLNSKPKFLIFDEPTRGIDIGAKEEIYKFMVELVKQGKYILMVSSDMPEIIAMCDRVYVMRNGSIVAEIEKEEISEENILAYSLGGNGK